MKPTTTTTTAAYTRHDTQLSIALRAKSASSACDYIRTLQNTRHGDKLTRSASDLQTEIDAITAEIDGALTLDPMTNTFTRKGGAQAAIRDCNRAIKAAEKQLKALTTTPNQRNEYRAIIAYYKRSVAALTSLIKSRRAEINRLDSVVLNRTFSDAAPMLHEATAAEILAAQEHYVITPEDMERAAEAWKKQTEKTIHAAQLRQAAATSALIFILTTTPEEATAAQFESAYTSRIFNSGTTAANRAIAAEMKQSTYNTTHTEKHLATAEELKAWSEIHGENEGKGYKVFTSRTADTWRTLEHRTYKREPSGYYIINHQRTYAPRISFESYLPTEDTTEAQNASERGQAAAGLINNGGIRYAENLTALEEIAALINRPNLTSRDRDFLNYWAKGNGEKYAQAAAAEYYATAKHPKRKTAERIRYEAAKQAAFNAIGLGLPIAPPKDATAEEKAAAENLKKKAQDAQSKFLQRLRARIGERYIDAAINAEHAAIMPLTAAEQAERDFKAIERLQRSVSRGHYTAATAAAVDIIRGVHEVAERIPPHKPILCMIQSAEPQPLTAEDIAAAAATERDRLAHIAAHADEDKRLTYRRRIAAAATDYGKSRAEAYTSISTAAAAALVFWDTLTAEEQARIITATATAAKLEKELEAIRAASRAEKPSITVSDFNKQTAAERVAFLSACNYLFELTK